MLTRRFGRPRALSIAASIALLVVAEGARAQPGPVLTATPPPNVEPLPPPGPVLTATPPPNVEHPPPPFAPGAEVNQPAPGAGRRHRARPYPSPRDIKLSEPRPAARPKTLDYTDGDAAPPGYHVESSYSRGLLIGGLVTFGGAYAVSVVIATTSPESASGNEHSITPSPLYIPLVGPFAALGMAHVNGQGAGILVFDGLVQSGGLAMTIAGLASRRKRLARDEAPEEFEYREGDPVPPHYRVDARLKRRRLAIAGLATFGGVYLLSAGIATVGGATDRSPRMSYAPLFVPVIGPFLAIRTTQSEDIATRALIADGVAQSVALAMAIAGLASPTTKLLRRVEALHVTPIATPRFTGLGVSGAF